MIDFLSGAVTFSYVVAAIYFVHFWRRSSEFLFLVFAMAFGLLALNQAALFVLGAANEVSSYAYLLRVLAFGVILAAIVAKNVSSRPRRSKQ